MFGKRPHAGRTKTRLAPALGAEGAAELYEAFLDDVLASARSVPGAAVELWIAGPEPGPLADRYEHVSLRRQLGTDLGERLTGAFQAAFEEGAERTVVVGSDHPTLPVDHLVLAFEALDAAAAVVGPTPDGGYWGLGLCAEAWPDGRGLFRDIPWSTGRVLEETRRRGRELGLELRDLPAWYDVDVPEEIDRMREDLVPGSATARTLRRLDPPAS